jgi:serine/threonine protein kinase
MSAAPVDGTRGPSAGGSLAEAFDELTSRLQAGEAVGPGDLERLYPRHAAELRQLLPALAALGDLSRSDGGGPAALPAPAGPGAEGGSAAGVLGDFRIIREVGRGGMGVVYEAEQLSLGRRVALKVLPFAATLDERQLQRFKNEARAAASLHHEHIVPVYAVGCERGVHYYAMQFLDGLTLAQVLDCQRQGGAAPPGGERTADYSPAPPAGAGAADTAPQAQETEPAPRDPAYFRRVAEWGAQAAEALEHAHQLGIVHRDIKPANLMLDGAGKLWATDFGLARLGADSGLTLTGDLVGTLRYMSPEQALAKRVVLDHRTDLYSLGVTLYELLTGQPAVGGSSREEILRQIIFAEPKRPRQRNKAIPLDLETVVLKAMAPEPERRYATAKELADDLRRFVADQPVRARRPTRTERAVRWVLRHKLAVRAGLWTVLLTLLVSLGSNVLIWQARQRSDDALQMAEARRQEAEEALRRMRVYRGETGEVWAEYRKQKATLEGILKVVNQAVDAAAEHDAGGSASGSERSLHEAASNIYQALLPPRAPPRKFKGPGVEVMVPGDAPSWDYQVDGWEYMRLGNALTQLGKFSEAKAVYAVALWHPPTTSWSPMPPAAVVRGYRRALALWRTRARAEEIDFINEHLLAVVNSYLYRDLARAREAEQTGAMGLTLLLTELPNLPTERGRSELLNYALQYMLVFRDPGRVPNEQGQFLRGRAYCQKLLLAALAWDRATALDPSIPAAEVRRLAEQYLYLGCWLRFAGLPDHGLEVLLKAASLCEKLGDDLPEGKLLPWELNWVLDVADQLKNKGKDAETERLYRLGRALAIRSTRTGAWPYHSPYQTGRLFQRLGYREEALRAFQKELWSGHKVPAAAAEHISQAELCRLPGKECYAAAVRLYGEAFAIEPKLIGDQPSGPRYNAARAAALAGCGQGKDADKLDAKACARLRQQALDWLQAELAACRKALESSFAESPAAVRGLLPLWLNEPDFAGVRGQALAGLPEGERAAWQHLWAKAALLLHQAQGNETPTPK